MNSVCARQVVQIVLFCHCQLILVCSKIVVFEMSLVRTVFEYVRNVFENVFGYVRNVFGYVRNVFENVFGYVRNVFGYVLGKADL